MRCIVQVAEGAVQRIEDNRRALGGSKSFEKLRNCFEQRMTDRELGAREGGFEESCEECEGN